MSSWNTLWYFNLKNIQLSSESYSSYVTALLKANKRSTSKWIRSLHTRYLQKVRHSKIMQNSVLHFHIPFFFKLKRQTIIEPLVFNCWNLIFCWIYIPYQSSHDEHFCFQTFKNVFDVVVWLSTSQILVIFQHFTIMRGVSGECRKRKTIFRFTDACGDIQTKIYRERELRWILLQETSYFFSFNSVVSCNAQTILIANLLKLLSTKINSRKITQSRLSKPYLK